MTTLHCELVIAPFEEAYRRAEDELATGLDSAAKEAAQEGVDAAKAQHPYRDRTHNLTDQAHVEPSAVRGDHFMTWPMEYASYVDQGTSRANPYPFTPLAEQAADRGLDHHARAAVDRFCTKISSR